MATVTVAVPGRSYPVLVGHGALQELGRLAKGTGASVAAVVTDATVAGLWGEPVLAGLSGAGLRAELLAVEPGERSKSLSTLERVLCFLEDMTLDRRDLVVALGGGTVGDLAGFAAAVWLRGVRCVQVPTTLLAMVDSSVGGKTGVNTARTKNAVGSITQPVAVLADLAVLSTLPEAEYLAAFGEVAKYAVAMDRALADRLRADRAELLARSPTALEWVVGRCVELKGRVVATDEADAGPRAILNYGHTVGHALESASGYAAAHGRAVAFGMEAAARIAQRLRLCPAGLVAEQAGLLAEFGLPGPLPPVGAEDVLTAVGRDKKSRGGRVRWVLPRELGRAQTGVAVPDEVVADVVRSLLP